MYCSSCGTQFSQGVRFCSRCGRGALPPASRNSVRSPGRRAFVFVGLVVFGLSLWIVAIIIATRSAPTGRAGTDRSDATFVRPPEDRKIEALSMCEQFVERRLKAPSTAKFSHVWDTTMTGSGDGPYRVSGFVDAQNSFGAMLRNHYVCTAQRSSSSDTWTLIDLTMR
jgi:hypothetical protein